MPRYRFVVSLTTPETDRERVQEYVADAVFSWCRQFNPGSIENNYEDRDPLFDTHSVVVTDPLTKSKVKA